MRTPGGDGNIWVDIYGYMRFSKIIKSEDLNIFPNRLQMASNARQNDSHEWSLGKRKSKPQWDTTSHPLGWPLSKKQNQTNRIQQKITSVGEDMEKIEPLCTVGGNVKRCPVHGTQQPRVHPQMNAEVRDILQYTPTWWILRVLRWVKQPHTDRRCRIPLCEVLEGGPCHIQRKQTGRVQGLWGGEDGGFLFNGDRVSDLQVEENLLR